MSTQTKEKPIIFSAPMIRALLEERKTMTRRVVDPQPVEGQRIGPCHFNASGYAIWEGDSCTCKGVRCPYQVGMRLWVKENLKRNAMGAWEYAATPGFGLIARSMDAIEWASRAAKTKKTQCPSMFMPRWASRITLEVTAVKRERLGEISEQDAMEEGFYQAVHESPDGIGDPREWFKGVWESLHGKGSWNENLWVGATSFRVVEDTMTAKPISRTTLRGRDKS